MNKQPKNNFESMPTYIFVTLIIQFLLFSPEIVSTIRNKETFTSLFKSIFVDFEDHLYLYGFWFFIIIFVFIHIFYQAWKRTAIKSGVEYSGIITGCLESLSQISRRSTTRYRYKVQLDDGREVYTQIYLSNEIEQLNLRTCTVYEYKGKFVFCDFK